MAPGRSIATAAGMAQLVSAYVRDFVQAELSENEALRRTGLTEDEWRAAQGPYLKSVLASGRYPLIALYVTEVEDMAPEAAFEQGLDGIAASIE